MKITTQTRIGELVADDFRTASIFQKHHIDFCCQGNKRIEEVCQNKQLEADQLIAELNQLQETVDKNGTDYLNWPLDLLCDYIEKTHHSYVEEKSIELKALLRKLVQVHGEKHPELLEIEHLFREAVGHLSKHMKQEELILFPFIRKMVQTKIKDRTFVPGSFGFVTNPIDKMKAEHEVEGERFRNISTLSSEYTVPADACNTYRVCFEGMKAFETDLHFHIHLENNILFPKAAELEQELLRIRKLKLAKD